MQNRDVCSDLAPHRPHHPAMPEFNSEKTDWMIGLAIAAVVCGGVYWLRSQPGQAPLIERAQEASKDIATFKLTEPLPLPRDGVLEVFTTVHECGDSKEQTVFSGRPCAEQAATQNEGRAR